MKARKWKKLSSNVLLPWERRRSFAAGLFSLRRWRAFVLWGLLGALLFAAFRVADARARVRVTRANIAEVERAVAAFRAEMGRCPRNETELVHPPRGAARYLNEVPTDAWGRELYVRCPSTVDPSSAEVVSAGPSGSFSIDDNVL
jgi:hypothetical protein